MLIQEKAIRHWMDHFYGYGSWNASFWFISYEEGDGDLPEEVAERLDYFYRKYPDVNEPTLCDIRELYRHVSARLNGRKAGLFENLHEYRFGGEAVVHTVWKNLIEFIHGYRSQLLADPLDYQKNHFVSGSEPGEALMRLFPLPSPHNHAWYYSWLDLPQFPFLKSREAYEQFLYGQRIKNILENIRTHKPKVVLMYGMNNINVLKNSVQAFFPNVHFKMVKAVKQHIPQHHRGDLESTTLLITTQIPALRHNRVETGFDWSAFGRAVMQNSTT
jgi:hypothetical protein